MSGECITRNEARNIAKAILDFRSRDHWFPSDLEDRLTAAMEGKTGTAAADAAELILETGLRLTPKDDPHDAIGHGWIVKSRAATVSVPAPGSDPNTLCSQFPAVLTLAEFD